MRLETLAIAACSAVLLTCSAPEPAGGEAPVAAPALSAAEPKSARRRKPSRCKQKIGRVESDTTLTKDCSPYTIRGGIDVLENTTLTIEPGVEVRFGSTDWLEIAAAATRGGKLVARGTAEEPIVLTGKPSRSGAPGTWLGLWFNAGTASGSILSHAIVRAAGGSNKFIKPEPTQGCITLTAVAKDAVTIEDVTLENCANAGIVLYDSEPRLSRLSMRDMPAGFLVSGSVPDSVLGTPRYANVAKRIVRRR